MTTKGNSYWYGIKIMVVLAGMFLLLGSTCISSRMVHKQVIAQQTAVVGSLYQKDADTCRQVLFQMFESSSTDEQTMAGKAALLEFGYTQEGLEYLYRQNELYQIQTRFFWIQAAVIFGILVLFWQVHRKQEDDIKTLIGDIHEWDFTSKALKSENYPACSRMLITEINTLLKKLAAAEKEAGEVKKMAQNFMENVAHQIKTPLSCVSISLDLLLGKLQEEMQKAAVQDAFGYLKQIEVLMKKLLNIGRLESGKLLLKKELVSLEEIMQECRHGLDPKEQRIVFTVDSDKAKDGTYQGQFYGDYEWLKEAFSNILKNALEHDASEGEIHVKLAYQKEMIFLQIRDFGTGIAKEDLLHIFDRFYIPNHAKSSHIGIGLNLAKLVIEKHFGTIEVVNHEEGGALFSILFPLYKLKNEKM